MLFFKHNNRTTELIIKSENVFFLCDSVIKEQYYSVIYVL